MADNKEATDIQVAAGLTAAGLLSDEGLQALGQVVQGAQDPSAAIGNAVFMALSKVRDKLEQEGMHIDDKLWLANGGVLDRVLFEVVSVLVAVFGMQEASNPEFVQNLKHVIVQLMEEQDSGGGEPPEGAMGPPGGGQMPPQGMPPQGAPMPAGGLMGGM